jgi:hypothetical protein
VKGGFVFLGELRLLGGHGDWLFLGYFCAYRQYAVALVKVPIAEATEEPKFAEKRNLCIDDLGNSCKFFDFFLCSPLTHYRCDTPFSGRSQLPQIDLTPCPAELLSVLDAAFRAGLLEIRRIRAIQEPGPKIPRPKGQRKDAPTSRIRNAIDILAQAPHPMYIRDLLEALEQRGLPARRDSLVSALTKLIAPAGPVLRVAPDTFTVKER